VHCQLFQDQCAYQVQNILASSLTYQCNNLNMERLGQSQI
jgi:hypothetical protein